MPDDRPLLHPADSVDGTDRAPDRYTRGGRETIDLIRDRSHELAESLLVGFWGRILTWVWPKVCRVPLGDLLFIAWCNGDEYKYRSRAGAKGDLAGDRSKAIFYYLMGEHVWDPRIVDDPRAQRPDFKSWQRRRAS